VKELSQRFTELEQELFTAHDANKKLQAEKDALETHLFALRQVQKDVIIQDTQSPKPLTENQGDPQIVMSVPDWVKTWRESKVFEKTSTAILVIGETGMALRPSIIKMMAKRLSLSAANKSLDEALNWLMTQEDKVCPILVEQIERISEHGSSSGGNLPAVLRLTQHGQTLIKCSVVKHQKKMNLIF